MLGRKMEEKIREKETECQAALAEIVPLASQAPPMAREEFDRVLSCPEDAPAPEPGKRGPIGRFFQLLGLAVVAVCIAVVVAGGCKVLEEMPAVEVCYTHPTYGNVCVTIGGKKYRLDRPDLTEPQKREVEEWIKALP